MSFKGKRLVGHLKKKEYQPKVQLQKKISLYQNNKYEESKILCAETQNITVIMITAS